jgi:outer membrane protein assembly factor BamB
VLKLRATDGEILKTAVVAKPNVCISWNTVLVNDSHGCYVATRWYGAPAWDSALRVFDADLNLVWERTGLPHGKKSTLTYAGGKLVVGSGNAWQSDYSGNDWKQITAYSVADGGEAWKCDLSKFDYKSILNTPYHGGHFYAETQDGEEFTSKVFCISAADGKLVDVIDLGRPVTSCATSIIAHGMILSGDLHSDGIVATRIAENSPVDWPGPFGDRQTNQLATDSAAGEELVPMRELSDERLVSEAGNP